MMLDSLFTLQSLLSLQGATAASLVVPNVLGYLFGKKFDDYRKYFSFAISFGLAFMVAVIAKVDWTGFVVAFFNGFLIFASAVGINKMGTKEEHPVQVSATFMRTKSFRKKSVSRQRRRVVKPKKEFFKNWF
ncbi:MAG: hypothetical protein PVJ67_00460 [Candidatus Pacearchaeota archaeon]|jgi:hypothetical protein